MVEKWDINGRLNEIVLYIYIYIYMSKLEAVGVRGRPYRVRGWSVTITKKHRLVRGLECVGMKCIQGRK